MPCVACACGCVSVHVRVGSLAVLMLICISLCLRVLQFLSMVDDLKLKPIDEDMLNAILDHADNKGLVL